VETETMRVRVGDAVMKTDNIGDVGEVLKNISQTKYEREWKGVDA
jgi:hypothetical protein